MNKSERVRTVMWFRRGADTQQIADKLGIPEWQVYNFIANRSPSISLKRLDNTTDKLYSKSFTT